MDTPLRDEEPIAEEVGKVNTGKQTPQETGFWNTAAALRQHEATCRD